MPPPEEDPSRGTLALGHMPPTELCASAGFWMTQFLPYLYPLSLFPLLYFPSLIPHLLANQTFAFPA